MSQNSHSDVTNEGFDRLILLPTALLGALAVVLGAWGAHGLEESLAAAGRIQVWETAVFYHFIHVLALLVLALASRQPWFWLVALFWGAGILLFSGSLYYLSLGGPSWLGPVTPLGGLFLILGWLLLAASAFRRTVQRSDGPTG